MSFVNSISALSPELILLIGACALLLLGIVDTGRVGRICSPAALFILLAALIATLAIGDSKAIEPAPGLRLDSLTYFVRWITLSVGAIIVLVNWSQPAAVERGEYMFLVVCSILGVLLTAEANDLVVLFLAVELVSVPTYVLIALSRVEPKASESAVKYFFLGALAAAILAYGIALTYGASGDTAIYRVAGGATVSALKGALGGTLGVIGLLLIFAGLSFKIAAVPFHAYAADVYEGAAAPITGMLGFIPKFAGFVALIKIFAALQWNIPHSTWWVIWCVAVATMTIGNVLALMQKSIKRLLAYSSITHTGYMLVALLAGPGPESGPLRDGVAAILFYISVYGLMNLGAFAALTWMRTEDRETEELAELPAAARSHPAAALALAVCVFSLSGLPPTAGFLAKFYVIGSAFSVPRESPMHGAMIALAIIAVINSAIGAAYYLRIIAATYLTKPVDTATEKRAKAPTQLQIPGGAVAISLGVCALTMLILFAVPDMLAHQTHLAARFSRSALTSPTGRMTKEDDKVKSDSSASSLKPEAARYLSATHDSHSAAQP
ncbi:MAG: NADH-quinone oxidoreductase subunit N [Planctomycetes bacterium]|nr:NADH-quinone oxidoreductase subunit N [Planctomycetota bacterium]